MAKEEIYHCDVKGCDKTANIHKSFKLQVIFETEQTEGRSSPPHFSNECIDLCDACMSHILKGNYLFGSGAQGHNDYYFKSKQYG